MESNVLCLSRFFGLPSLSSSSLCFLSSSPLLSSPLLSSPLSLISQGSARVSHYNDAEQLLSLFMAGGQTDGSVTIWDAQKQEEVEQFGSEKNQGTIR